MNFHFDKRKGVGYRFPHFIIFFVCELLIDYNSDVNNIPSHLGL